MTSRLHPFGPLVEYRQDRPGWVSIRLTFDEPWTHVMPHVHAFEHEMIVESGKLQVQAGKDAAPVGLEAGDRITVPAGGSHSAVPLSGGTVARCDHQIPACERRALP